jgi:hypothetical protein
MQGDLGKERRRTRLVGLLFRHSPCFLDHILKASIGLFYSFNSLGTFQRLTLPLKTLYLSYELVATVCTY